ncbi:MAG: sulfatase-like hydrolase/transferase, partial [bacterium]
MTDKPNIILIITDQQQADMMSCAGNDYVHTPAMDRLAASGVRFTRSYCTDPVCVPSRFSLMTGRMPLDIGLRGNYADRIDPVPEDIKKQGLGWQLQEAGYETVYGGKVHLPKMSIEEAGFNYITSDE